MERVGFVDPAAAAAGAHIAVRVRLLLLVVSGLLEASLAAAAAAAVRRRVHLEPTKQRAPVVLARAEKCVFIPGD